MVELTHIREYPACKRARACHWASRLFMLCLFSLALLLFLYTTTGLFISALPALFQIWYYLEQMLATHTHTHSTIRTEVFVLCTLRTCVRAHIEREILLCRFCLYYYAETLHSIPSATASNPEIFRPKLT